MSVLELIEDGNPDLVELNFLKTCPPKPKTSATADASGSMPFSSHFRRFL
jgi:hypothetical protein